MATLIVARFQIKKEHVGEVRKLMREMAAESRKEPGNSIYDVYYHPDDETKLIIYERYQDDEAVEAHRGTPHFRKLVLERVVPLLDMRAADVFHAE